jgi:regulator of sigma E protease
MQIGWDIFWFLIGVSLLVTVHEFGHFWVARKLGFKVLRFSIGFGKPLWKRVGKGPDHTEFVVAALPLGGYVKLVDERDGPVSAADQPRAYQSKRPWQRILMLLAGPGANFIFAILLLWAVYLYFGIVHVKAQVDTVVTGKPAAIAGLRAEDEVRAVNGKPVFDQLDANLGIIDAISGDGRIELDVRDRNGRERQVTIVVADGAERFRLTEPNALYEGLGFDFWRPSLPAVLGKIQTGGPADVAGLQPGDRITALDGTKLRSFNELADYVNARPDKTIRVSFTRGEESFTRDVQARSDKDPNTGRVIGRFMVEPSTQRVASVPNMMTRTSVGVFDAFGASLAETWKMTEMQARFFWRMLTGNFSYKNLSSPIGIADFAGDSARGGVETFLVFLVLISLSLGFLNLLPIPILDGGQVLFALTEWVKGGPLSERVQALTWNAGLLMLVALMGVAIFNDLSARLVSP